MKKLIIFGLLLIPIHKISAQLSIGYFPFQSELSISTNVENVLWGDLRMTTNTFFGNITMEPILLVNIMQKEVVNLYAGAGMNINFFNAASGISVINGYSLHIGTRIKPLKNLRNLHLIFEISPYMNRYFDGGLLRTRMGIAYHFKRGT